MQALIYEQTDLPQCRIMHCMSAGLPYSAHAVGARVAALRLAFGFDSQAAFAEAIGVQRGEVAAWESGGRRPSIAKAQPMVEKFGITLDWLFLGDPRGLRHEVALKLIGRKSEDAR